MLMAGNLANVGPSVGGFGRVLTGTDQKTNPGGGKKCPRVELAKGCGHAMVFLMMLKRIRMDIFLMTGLLNLPGLEDLEGLTPLYI